MSPALLVASVPGIVLYCGSLVLVIWAVADVARRSVYEIPHHKKTLWIIGSIAGWLLFGVGGAVVACCYLLGPRRRLNAMRRHVDSHR